MFAKSSLVSALALCSSLVSAVNPLKVQGANFVDSVTSSRFVIIGADYQPGGSAGYLPQQGLDPLSNPSTCLRDAAVLQQLGVNAIRIYNLDPDVNHDMCASIFNAAGIYMIIDVNSPLANQALDAGAPWTSYDRVYMNRTFAIVENFKNYPNVIGFFSGNEVINDLNSGNLDPPYIRAVTRDIKNYISKHAPRAIPVGYSAADVRPILQDTSTYLQCSIPGDTNDMSKIDFFGLNSYSWCGNNTFAGSTYEALVDSLGNTTVPIFFSEYGCIKVYPRIFQEVGAIYGPDMRNVMSGALVYEYSQEVSGYGLVVINSNGSISLLQDFVNFQNQLDQIDISALTAQNSTATAIPAFQCSPSLIENAGFNNNFTLIPVAPGVSDLINSGVPNALQGSVVKVTQTAVSQQIYGVNGQLLPALSLNLLPNNEVNVPGNSTEESSSSPSGSGTTAATPSATSGKSAASALEVSGFWTVLAAALVALF